MEEENHRAAEYQLLGTAKVGKLLRMFAIPCVLSLIIQALYNLVDQLFIGNSYLGEVGNAATGIVYPLTVIALAFGLFLGDGAAAVMSLNQGKNQTKETHKAIGTCLSVGVIISVILIIVAYALRGPILRGFGANDEIYPKAYQYSTFIIAGFLFFILSSMINPIIRADGSPRYAMFAMTLGAVTNIILDPIFIYANKMGMNGAALATFIGQGVTFVISVAYLFRAKTFRLQWQSLRPDVRLLGQSLRMGISSFLTQIVIVVISVVSNNILGLYVIGGKKAVSQAIGLFTVAFKVFGIVISIAIGVASGGQPIVGYNYGAKKYDRVKQAFRQIMLTTLLVGLVATILFEACPQIFIRMFGATVNDFALRTFRIYLGLIVLTCLTKAASIFFQAVGMPVKATVVAMLRDLILLVPLVIILPMLGGIDWFFWSAPIADIVTFIVAVILVVTLWPQLKNVTDNQTDPVAIQNSRAGRIITVSREHGAGGHEIGEQVAKRLGIPFYDKEIAMLSAQESGLSAEYIAGIENQSSLLYNLYLSAEVNQTALKAQKQVLQNIAAQGACVIVGRAADFVLADYQPLKIFVRAPLDYKIQRIMQNYGDTKQKAKTNITKSDQRRAQFYQSVTGQKWADPANYHLVVDSSMGIDKAVDLILNSVVE